MLSEVELGMKQGNKGQSLVELISTMAILALVSMAIIGFLTICFRQYENAESEINLQHESQLAMNQIQEFVIDATHGVGYEPGRLFIYNYDGQAGAEEKIELKQEGSKILYTKYHLDADNVWRADDSTKDLPFADYVSSFSAVLYDKEGQEAEVEADAKEIEQIKVHLEFAWKNRDFSADNIITLRNTVVASTDVEKIFTDITPGTTPKVQDVTVSPASVSLWAGSTGNNPFSATVIGNSLTDTSVRWELGNPGSVSEGTKITENGILSIGEEETQNFTVKAVSVLSQQLGNQKYGTANVLVKSLRGLYINSLYRNEDTMTATALISVTGKNLEGSSEEKEDISQKLQFSFLCQGKEVTDIYVTQQEVETAAADRYSYRYSISVPEHYKEKAIVMRVEFQGNSELLAEDTITFLEKEEKQVNSLRLYKVGNQGLQESEIYAYPGGSFVLRAVAGYSDETTEHIAYEDSKLTFVITEGSQYVAENSLKDNGTITLKSQDIPEEATVTVEAEYEGCKDKIKFYFRDAGFIINEMAPGQKQEFITVGEEYAVPLTFTVWGISDYSIECAEASGMQVSMEGNKAMVHAESAGDYQVVFTLIDRTNGCDTQKTVSLGIHAGEPNLKYKKWSLWKGKYIYYMLEPSWYVPDILEWQKYIEGDTLYSLGNRKVAAKTIKKEDSFIKGEYIKIDGEAYHWEDGFWVSNRTFD